MTRDRYVVGVEQYVHYQKNGYLLIPGLLPTADWQKIAKFMMDLYEGRLTLAEFDSFVPGAGADTPIDGLLQKLARVHMLHRIDATMEWALLHPLLLDVLEALIGPDVLALQSMIFYNPPGRGGQGWHQDAYYIPTFPDTLIGAWVALDEVDEENGCLWVAPGSNNEPVYPPVFESVASVHAQDAFADLHPIENASHLDDEVNTLSRIAGKYDGHVPVRMKPGDVLFFQSHLLHRSHPNRSAHRFRKSFVGHYCNARSWVPWNHGHPFEGDAANNLHILGRGSTHLPYASPKFGTEVEIRAFGDGSPAPRMMGMGSDMMPAMTMDTEHDD